MPSSTGTWATASVSPLPSSSAFADTAWTSWVGVSRWRISIWSASMLAFSIRSPLKDTVTRLLPSSAQLLSNFTPSYIRLMSYAMMALTIVPSSDSASTFSVSADSTCSVISSACICVSAGSTPSGAVILIVTPLTSTDLSKAGCSNVSRVYTCMFCSS